MVAFIIRLLLTATMAVLSLIYGIIGQALPSAAFDAVSVKPAQAAAARTWNFQPGGRFVAENISLGWLIRIANDMLTPLERVVGGPGWLDVDLFNVDARVNNARWAELSAVERTATLRQMLQALLADRFGLQTHRETRQPPVYELTKVTSAPQLKPSVRQQAACDAAPADQPCHRLGGGPGRGLKAEAVEMAEFARTLSVFSGRPVVDRTGLIGLFDFETEPWQPLQPGVSDSPDVTIFTVLQETLGLKLVAARGPVEVIVVDRARKPSAD